MEKAAEKEAMVGDPGLNAEANLWAVLCGGAAVVTQVLSSSDMTITVTTAITIACLYRVLAHVAFHSSPLIFKTIGCVRSPGTPLTSCVNLDDYLLLCSTTASSLSGVVSRTFLRAGLEVPT